MARLDARRRFVRLPRSNSLWLGAARPVDRPYGSPDGADILVSEVRPSSPIGRGNGLKHRQVWVRVPPGAPKKPGRSRVLRRALGTRKPTAPFSIRRSDLAARAVRRCRLRTLRGPKHLSTDNAGPGLPRVLSANLQGTLKPAPAWRRRLGTMTPTSPPTRRERTLSVLAVGPLALVGARVCVGRLPVLESGRTQE